jgi:hypothetical protein
MRLPLLFAACGEFIRPRSIILLIASFAVGNLLINSSWFWLKFLSKLLEIHNKQLVRRVFYLWVQRLMLAGPKVQKFYKDLCPWPDFKTMPLISSISLP